MYKFVISEQGGAPLEVHPIYGEDMKLTVERESNEMFCRYDFGGTLHFCGKDYDFFESESILIENEVVVYWANNRTPMDLHEIMRIPFTKADLTFDQANKEAILKLKGKDQYEEFLNKYDSEYDLVKLAPRKESVLMYKSAFLQLYVFGDTKLTHILGNFEYEVDANALAPETKKEDIVKMGFTPIKEYMVLDVTLDPTWGLTGYDGVYSGNKADKVLWNEDRTVKCVKATDEGGGWNLVKVNPDPKVFYLKISVYDTLEFKTDIYFQKAGTGEGFYGGEVFGRNRDIYGRIVMDKKVEKSLDISFDTDVWQKNLNYRYCISLKDAMLEYEMKNRVILSDEKTDTPNQWQTDGHGKYFVQPPATILTERIIAVGWNQWIPYSIWFKNSPYVSGALSQYDVTWKLDDAYPLRDCIEKLLSKVAPGIGLKSEFIDNNGLGGISNPILGDGKRLWLFLTPVTNIKKTYYNQASQKGGITLKQILDMMRMCFGCYWCLKKENGQWFLRIEHISWFDNGGDYVSPISYGDLYEELVNLSKKNWITEQNKYSFDMGDIYSRKEFSWGDKASEIFNGYPYEAKENIANKKPIVKEQVANFVSEVDLIVSSPDSVSDDMFVVIGADDELEEYKIYREKIGHYNDSGYITDQYPQYIPQNSMLPFYFTEQKFLNYNMPGLRNDSIKMDGEGSSYVPIKSKAKLIRQTVHVPFEIEKPDLAEEKFSTGLDVTYGMGRIERIEANLSTQDAEIELTFNYKQ